MINAMVNAQLALEPQSPVRSKIKHWIGLDRAIAFTIMGRGWSAFAGLVTIFLIARFLSPDQQGYYYTFGSLVAVQIIFELGFSFVVQQMASHERAHLEILNTGEILGAEKHQARLASILQKTVRWYSVAALAFFAGLLPIGFFFFSTHKHSAAPVAWQFPWLLVAVVATLTFLIDPIFAFLEGCGHVALIAQTRFVQACLGSLLAWSALLLHRGLFSPALMILGQALVGVFRIWRNSHLLSGLWHYPAGSHKVAWFQEVWPFQWRIAVSWISGYFIFQLFNPILFAYRGAAEAGQMGMSLSIGSAVLNVGISWIATKSAPFGVLVARRQFAELDRIFFRSLTQSSVVTVMGCLATWLATVYLYNHGIALSHRILDPLSMGLLLLTVAVNQIVFAEAIYLRSHKKEKFLPLSVANACCMALSTYCLGRLYGARGMMAGYLLINLVIGLGLGTRTFLKFRKDPAR
jgi:hypothetical protein